MADLPFKQLSVSNWLQRDPVMELFGTCSDEGSPRPISDIDLVESILQPRLHDTVPTEVRGLYEAARGGMCYGYFFYPLYTLATQQLFRVAEAAVTHRTRQLDAPPGVNNLARGIEFLSQRNIVSDTDRSRWDAVRLLRNRMSHVDSQEIMSPGMAIDSLGLIAELCNQLYAS